MERDGCKVRVAVGDFISKLELTPLVAVMSTEQARLARWRQRLIDLPSLALPTDYPRPSDEKSIAATQTRALGEKTRLALLTLAIQDDEGSDAHQKRPTPFHLLLSAFALLLHRFTGDTDLVLATSSSSGEPLLLRFGLEPTDPFWTVLKRVQDVEKEAESDSVPYDSLVKALGREPKSGPLFRVRFFDETDRTESKFLQSTSSTSDLTVYVTADGSALSSSRASPVPALSLRLDYNSLLFSNSRIRLVLDQLEHVILQLASAPLSQIGKVSLVTPAQQKILPDPRADLDFCGFKGAITDIFSRNARSFPERVCIVESVTQPSVNGAASFEPAPNRLRVFTYRQIDEASNVVAHHLVSNGIEREDVVTVYSTRGVDLVVAVMGVLKAGATFSVIGQLHPCTIMTKVYRR
jgi:L-aminoadipate-semialdehyde dehydrogenase